MRHIDLLRTLALSSALVLALGGPSIASAGDTSDTGESPSVEASESEESPSVEAAPPATTPAEADDEASAPAEKADTEVDEAEEE